MNQPATTTVLDSAQRTTFAILFAVAFCHLLNDLEQALYAAIYPILKARFDLSFAQIGLVTTTYLIMASFLQPLVGLVGDRRPLPYTLPWGACFTFFGLLLLSVAWSYPVLLFSSALVGVGSSTFHPESSRVARAASGGRFGLAQSMFQVGGNFGTAFAPLLAAFVVVGAGQGSVAWFSGLALITVFVLWRVAAWYKTHGIRNARAQAVTEGLAVPRGRMLFLLFVLLMLILSKQVYLAAFQSYYIFYLIDRFHLSLQLSQVYLFVYFAGSAVGTLAGGPIGDRFGRKFVIWFSILGALPFALMLPYAGLLWTILLSTVITVIMSAAFPAIVVYGQELLPGRVGAISGLFFGVAFGVGGLAAALLGVVADYTNVEYVFWLCGFLPAIGLLAAFLPDLDSPAKRVGRPIPA